MFLRSKQVPFEFVDVANVPDKRRALEEKLGSPTGGVIFEDGDSLTAMQGVSVAKLSRYLNEYQARHSAD